MKELKRTKVGNFSIENSVHIKELEEKIEKQDLSDIISIEQIFKEKDKIDLDSKNLDKYLNGVNIYQNCEDDIYRIYVDNKFTGLGTVKDNKLKRDVVLK